MHAVPRPVRRLALAVAAAGIAFLSHQPTLRLLPPLFPMQDKVFHLVEFAILGAVLVLNGDLFGTARRIPLIVLAGVAWAALDEMHQAFVPGRDCSTGDFLADCAGVILAVALLEPGDRSSGKVPGGSADGTV